MPQLDFDLCRNRRGERAKTENTNQTQTARRNIATIHASSAPAPPAPPAPFSCSSSGPQMLANKRSNSELASKKGQKRARNPNASGARVFCRAKWTQQKRVSLPAQPH